MYDEAKRFAETLTMTYHRLYDLPTAIVRIFNTYGPRLRPADGRVVSNFLVQAIDGKPLTIYGTRHADPFVLLRRRRGARASSRCSTPTSSSPVNIGNPIEFTMLELADARARGHRLERPSSCSSRCPIGDPTRRRPDITRARELLGWEPKIELREGLERMHAWYLEERARGRA